MPRTRKVDSENIIVFPHGLIGFPGMTRFSLLDNGEDNPFAVLRSKENSSMRFPMIDPLLIRPDYEIVISPEEIEELEIENRSDVQVFSMVVIPADGGDATINFRSPILISRTNGIGVQILLPAASNPIAASLADELKREEAEMMT